MESSELGIESALVVILKNPLAIALGLAFPRLYNITAVSGVVIGSRPIQLTISIARGQLIDTNRTSHMTLPS